MTLIQAVDDLARVVRKETVYRGIIRRPSWPKKYNVRVDTGETLAVCELDGKPIRDFRMSAWDVVADDWEVLRAF